MIYTTTKILEISWLISYCYTGKVALILLIFIKRRHHDKTYFILPLFIVACGTGESVKEYKYNLQYSKNRT